MRSILSPVLIALLMLLSACMSCKHSGAINESAQDILKVERQSKRNIDFVAPLKGQKFKDSDLVYIRLALKDTSKRPDSIQVIIDNKKLAVVHSINDSILWNMDNSRLGNRNLEAVGYYQDGARDHVFIQVSVLLSKPPMQYTYRIENVFPHSKNAYTQGLVFDNGFMYESTGIYGQSTLQKIKYKTGEVLSVFNLPNTVFGEGIAMFDDKIIQISWKEQIAFIYDKETFQLINKLYYPVKEGWGITYNGSNLIMSDGSNILYTLDKDYFTELSRIEVYDDNGPVKDLNELEYVDGEIWANVYTSDVIACINPQTGAVVGKIDLSGLLKPEDKTNTTNVLNGIAFDSEAKRIFVTGKNWPKLFEISLVSKK